MCNVCGVYLLDAENLPDVAAALESFNVSRKEAVRLVDIGATAAITLDFLLSHSNNRGNDSAGIVTFDGENTYRHVALGFAHEAFNHNDPKEHVRTLEGLVGGAAIGHDRYATTGRVKEENIQPFLPIDNITIAHNGNLVNEKSLRRKIKAEEQTKWGQSKLTSSTDSELIQHLLLLAHDSRRITSLNIKNAIGKESMSLKGAYSVVGLMSDTLFAFRDPHGVWPLYIARLGNLILFNSEISAINHLVRKSNYRMQKSDFIRMVNRGEVEIVSKEILETHRKAFPAKDIPKSAQRCSFDYAYLLNYEDLWASRFRQICGRMHWDEHGVPGNPDEYVVAPVPRSGIHLARGLAEASGIPYERLLEIERNRARTFQKPTQKEREEGARRKYLFKKSYDGIKAILTDDSIVRDTTMKYLVKSLRERGIEELHLRIGTPPIITPCYLGIHTPLRDELIAHHLNQNEIGRYFGSIFFGVDYEQYSRNELISMAKKMSVEEMVQKSVKDGKNFLNKKQMRKPGSSFSLKYTPLDKFKDAFERTGLRSETKCYACMMPRWSGYPEEFRPYLPKAA